MPRYIAYGLCIESEFPLPLPVPASEAGIADLVVRRGTFEAPPREARLIYDVGGASYGPCDGGILVRAKESGDFLISGSSILVASGASDDLIGDLVARMALGFVLQLRSMLAFHGAAASLGGHAIAVLGARGAGKSTTAVGLASRGWDLLCDDIVVVEPDLTVPLGAVRARLCADSYERLAGGRNPINASRDIDGKYTLDSEAGAREAPLSAVFIVEAAEVERVESHALRGYAKLSAVLAHLHSPQGIGDAQGRLGRAAAALSKLPVLVLRRPSSRFALDELLDTLEESALREDS